MKRFSTGIFAVLCMASLACGGGGSDGGGGGDCAGMATAINACIVDLGGTADSTIQGQCEVTTCTGSKTAAIDCMKAAAATCNDTLQTDAMACESAQGCSLPATCQGVAYTVWNCSGGDSPVADTLASCNATTCTGSKTAAMECIVALDCATATESDMFDCLDAEGCTFPM